MPEWLTEDLIRRTTEHFRRLQGRWRSTPFGATLELQFEVARGDTRRPGRQSRD
jgi:hypothetical protein